MAVEIAAVKDEATGNTLVVTKKKDRWRLTVSAVFLFFLCWFLFRFFSFGDINRACYKKRVSCFYYMPTPDYTIILFYNYVRITDPELLASEQRTICTELGLKGRVIIAHEGVNITLEGTTENIEKYCVAFLADSRFADTHIKKSAGTGASFPKLSVKVRKEIVSLHLPPEKELHPRDTAGTYITADQFHELLEKKARGEDDFEIIDMRNDYEHEVGHFKGSILPPLHHFRDLPHVLPTLPHVEALKEKKIIAVCTGGVRCEKATGYLIKEGFKNVYQLHGGIVTYMEKYEKSVDVADSPVSLAAAAAKPAGNFLGSLYVFDDRITMAFASKEARGVIGKCARCGVASEHYVNCANQDCHRHFIICDMCTLGEPREGLVSGPVCSLACSAAFQAVSRVSL